jgi:hypothetical protein
MEQHIAPKAVVQIPRDNSAEGNMVVTPAVENKN